MVPVTATAELVRVYWSDHSSFVLDVSIVAVGLVVLVLAGLAWNLARLRSLRRYDVVQLDIELGGIGKIEVKPNNEDIQVAHRIWAELVTRKAAIPFDPDHDVIVEIYDSWYAMFQRIRQLIGEIPGHMLRREESTRRIVRIATETLNLGIRPHLTRWQARFRTWYARRMAEEKAKPPQDVQREFPDYQALTDDLKKVNGQLIQYVQQLE